MEKSQGSSNRSKYQEMSSRSKDKENVNSTNYAEFYEQPKA